MDGRLLTAQETMTQLTMWRKRHAILWVIAETQAGVFRIANAWIKEVSNDSVKVVTASGADLSINFRKAAELCYDDLIGTDQDTISLAASSRSTMTFVFSDGSHCTLYEARLDPVNRTRFR
jgi:hypothetical protein